MTQGSTPHPPVIDYYTPKHHASSRLPGVLVAILIAGGVVVPTLVMGLATLLLLVNGLRWPLTSRQDAMMVLAHPVFAWPFYAMAVMASVAVIRLIRNPPLAAMNRWVRVPLWLGLAINVQYMLIVAACRVGSSDTIGLALADALGAAVFLGVVIATRREPNSAVFRGLVIATVRESNLAELPERLLLRTISRRMGIGLLGWFGCLVAGVVCVAVANDDAIVVIVAPLLFLALPHLQIVAFASALLVVSALAPALEHRRDMPLWLRAYACGWVACGGLLAWAWYLFTMR